jgi:hypothetical protein
MRCSASPQTKRHVSVKQGMRETEQWLTKAAHPNSFHLTGELRKRGVVRIERRRGLVEEAVADPVMSSRR